MEIRLEYWILTVKANRTMLKELIWCKLQVKMDSSFIAFSLVYAASSNFSNRYPD